MLLCVDTNAYGCIKETIGYDSFKDENEFENIKKDLIGIAAVYAYFVERLFELRCPDMWVIIV